MMRRFVFTLAASQFAAAHYGAHNEFEMLDPTTIMEAPQSLRDEANCVLDVLSPANLLINDGDWVTVSWSCAQLPANATWIGAYSPALPDWSAIRQTYPVRMTFNLPGPSGSVRFQMGNYRNPIQFHMLSGGNVYPAVCCPYWWANSSKIVSFAQPNQPVRPRLVVMGDHPTGQQTMRLLWSTNNSAAPTVQWGTDPASLQYNLSATTVNIPRSTLFNAPANETGYRDLGAVHHAEFDFSVLTPEQRRGIIHYRFGDASQGLWSALMNLTLPPAPGGVSTRNPVTSADQPLSLAIFGDYGRGSFDDTQTWIEYGRPAVNTTVLLRQLSGLEGTTTAASSAIGGRTISAAWIIGDHSYANGILAVWESYLDMTAAFATRVPMISLLGNHELNSIGDPSLTFISGNDGGGEGGMLTQVLAPMPRPASTTRAWYSLNIGLVHLIGLSTEQPFWPGTPQYGFLQDDLARVNRSLTPWVVLAAHRPMYISSTDGPRPGRLASDQNISALMQQHLEPLIWAGQVNLALYGHNHAVQRLSAAYGNRLVQASLPATMDGQPARLQYDPQATVHYVVGNGGAGFTRNFQTPSPPWCEMVEYQFGLGVLTAHNASHLQWRVLENTQARVIDNLWIVRPNASAPWVLPPQPPSGSGGISTAQIVGAVAGALAGVGLVAAIAIGASVFVRRRFGSGAGAGQSQLKTALSNSFAVKVDNPAAAAAIAASLPAAVPPPPPPVQGWK